MGNSSKKRIRSSNWEEEERRILKELVTEKLDIIENKDTSTKTNNMKKAAWQEVLSRFNNVSNNKRNMSQLVTQWRNTKWKVKTKKLEDGRARLTTDEAPPSSLTTEDLAIIHGLPNEFVDSYCFDSNRLYAKTFKQITSSADYEEELFLLTKKSKEREFERAEELHAKRKTIMGLEEEYWTKKINSL